MGHTQNIRRFRTNPIEIAIFAIVTIICARSVYNLFYDHDSFSPAALTPMAANPTSEITNSRNPASVIQSFMNYDFKCGAQSTFDTGATKVRVTGSLCGPNDTVVTGDQLVKTQVINEANKFSATVFMDVNASKFSTDYIPLNAGKNPIRVEFANRDGNTVTQNITINKN